MRNNGIGVVELVRTQPDHKVRGLNCFLTENFFAPDDPLLINDTRVLVWEMFRPQEDQSSPLELVYDVNRDRSPRLWRDDDVGVYLDDPTPPGRNSRITSFCPAITAALRGSHNLEFNGLGHQIRSTLYYLTKYFSKDPHPFANTLSLAYAATRHVEQFPSVAEDRGTDQLLDTCCKT